MADCWNTFKSLEGEYQTVVILTTASNESMVPPGMGMTLFPDEHKPIHDRMPVILEPGECDDWLDSEVFAQLVLQRPGPGLALTLVQP